MITTKKIADYLSFPSFFPARSSIIAPVSVCVVCSVFEKISVFSECIGVFGVFLSELFATFLQLVGHNGDYFTFLKP